MIGPVSVSGWATGLLQELANPVQGFKSACQMSLEMGQGGGVYCADAGGGTTADPVDPALHRAHGIAGAISAGGARHRAVRRRLRHAGPRETGRGALTVAATPSRSSEG